MRCPKCGYVSFDYNLSCPKCNKDISDQHEKMHIASFRPNPPSLLGALLGETNESNVALDISGIHGPVTDYEEAGRPEHIGLDDSSDLDIELESEADDLTFDDSGFDVSSEEDVLDLESQSAEENLSLKPAVLSEEPEPDLPVELEAPDTIGEPEIEDNGLSLDFEDLALRSDEEEKFEQTEMEINLDDLKVDETGELEVAAMAESLTPDDEKKPADDLSLGQDQTDSGAKDTEKTMQIDPSSSLLPDLDLDDTDKGIEIEDLSSDEFLLDASDAEAPSLEMDDTEVDFQEIAFSDSEEEITFETEDVDMALDIDLENLDLELDIDFEDEDTEKNQ